jgi:hypothetical protein
MNELFLQYAIEIGFLGLLGIIYYFYEKRKLLHYEKNKGPLVANFILQACLAEKNDQPQPELDALILLLDDFINQSKSDFPVEQLKLFAGSPECPSDLKNIIIEGLKELEINYG